MYSIGVMLLEIAFWEPAHVFQKEGQRHKDAEMKMHQAAEKELASEVGGLYRDAVVRCLKGLRHAESGPAKLPSGEAQRIEYDGTYRGEDSE